MQELLTASAELIVLVFSAAFLLDLAIALNNCWIASAIKLSSPRQLEAPPTAPQIRPENIAIALVLPDPWMLPIDEVAEISIPQRYPPDKQKPLLLLPAAKEEIASSVPITAAPNLDELFLNIDIDKLQLRLARKIAKELGISKKLTDVTKNFLGSERRLKRNYSTLKNCLQQQF
ncbi:MAG: hypothetical protein KME05_21800 [Gloeocapsa sp. UFS-A4-WI-NPMV-4B04]|jgi:hypothetical protein|nr:hypothetical protein [Gloeocapsa sp. UFS-A4-WI-NPMV-4B04]